MANKYLNDPRIEKLENVAKGMFAMPPDTEAERKESDAWLKQLILASKEKIKQ